MKIVLLVLSATFFSLTSWGNGGGGGVDVGNANQKGRFSVPDFATEEEMVSFVQQLLPKIEKGELKEVQRLLSKGRCSHENIKFDELEVISSYRYHKSMRKLEKEFSGLVTIELKDCKRPRNL